MQEKVSFIDFQENIWPYYDAIDITIVPSTEKESFGLVATEAMLSKKPVIAANHGGLVEIVKPNETGLLFEANNAIDLSEKIAYLLENPELIKIYGENGFSRVSENFSTKKYVNSFTKEYEKLTQ